MRNEREAIVTKALEMLAQNLNACTIKTQNL